MQALTPLLLLLSCAATEARPLPALNLAALADEPAAAPPARFGEDGDHEFRAHRLPDGRHLVWNWRGREHEVFIRERTGALVPAGRGFVLPVAGAGQLVVRDSGRSGVSGAEVCDVDPDAPRLRVLWSSDAAVRVVPLGSGEGSVFLLMSMRSGGPQLVTLTAGERPQARAFDLGRFDHIATVQGILEAPFGDAVRGHRLLVAQFDGRSMHSMSPAAPPPREAELGVYDLRDGSVRSLGKAPAVIGIPLGETIFLPMLSVEWVAREHLAARRAEPGAPRVLVVEEDESVVVGK